MNILLVRGQQYRPWGNTNCIWWTKEAWVLVRRSGMFGTCSFKGRDKGWPLEGESNYNVAKGDQCH